VGEGTFDRLIITLKESERKDLLERLSKNSGISMEPLYERKPEILKKAEDAFAELSLVWRIWFYIIGFFLGKPPVRMYENSAIAKIGREINITSPGYYNYTQGLLLSDTHKALGELKNAVRFFYNALDSSVNKDKGAFYAFMASFEAPEIHELFSRISDPGNFSKLHPDMGPELLKQAALDAYSETLSAMTESQREKMYRDVRSLICLKELSSFLYDRLIANFRLDAASRGHVCPAAPPKGQLAALNNILFSLKQVPSLALLSTLFIFSQRETFENKSETLNYELQKLMAQTEKSLATIRNFNKNVPLTQILRCITKDTSYEPHELPGGEDWFVIFRNYWKDKIEESYDDYLLEVKRAEIDKAFDIFFGESEIINVESKYSEDSIPVENALLFSFLLTFYKKIFIPDMNQVLRPILIDGDFAKKENRIDFTESYNELIKMEDAINGLVKKTGPGGDYGTRHKQLKIDVVSPVIRHRKLQILFEDASEESFEIAQKAKTALGLMNAVIHGILVPVEDAKYASLTNLSTMLGKANREFMIALKDTSDKLMLAVDLVGNITDVEGASEGNVHEK
jgi:hypothetical protein